MTPNAETQTPFKNILFATDFSAAATAAVPYVASFARVHGAALWALHVRPPTVNTMAEPIMWTSLEEAAKAQAEEQRQILLTAFAGLSPQVLIEEGDLWPIMKRTIEANKINLLVMGTSGRSGGGKLLLGSVAEEVFRKAPCPVLTVGPHSPAKPGLDAEISRILFATSLGPKSAGTAACAISLTQTYQAYLTLLHVVGEPKKNGVAQHTGLVKSCEAHLCSLVPPEAKLWCIPDYRVERGGSGGEDS